MEDVLQEVFIRIHRGLLRGDVPRDANAWVHRITRTTLIDHYRSRAADKSAPHPDPTRDSIEPTTATVADEEREMARCMRPFIAALAEPYRSAMTWTGIEGLSQTAAAERAQISVSGMKSRVQRGRRQMAALLQQCCAFEFDGRGAPITPDSGCDGC